MNNNTDKRRPSKVPAPPKVETDCFNDTPAEFEDLAQRVFAFINNENSDREEVDHMFIMLDELQELFPEEKVDWKKSQGLISALIGNPNAGIYRQDFAETLNKQVLDLSKDSTEKRECLDLAKNLNDTINDPATPAEKRELLRHLVAEMVEGGLPEYAPAVVESFLCAPENEVWRGHFEREIAGTNDEYLDGAPAAVSDLAKNVSDVIRYGEDAEKANFALDLISEMEGGLTVYTPEYIANLIGAEENAAHLSKLQEVFKQENSTMKNNIVDRIDGYLKSRSADEAHSVLEMLDNIQNQQSNNGAYNRAEIEKLMSSEIGQKYVADFEQILDGETSPPVLSFTQQVLNFIADKTVNENQKQSLVDLIGYELIEADISAGDERLLSASLAALAEDIDAESFQWFRDNALKIIEGEYTWKFVSKNKAAAPINDEASPLNLSEMPAPAENSCIDLARHISAVIKDDRTPERLRGVIEDYLGCHNTDKLTEYVESPEYIATQLCDE